MKIKYFFTKKHICDQNRNINDSVCFFRNLAKLSVCGSPTYTFAT